MLTVSQNIVMFVLNLFILNAVSYEVRNNYGTSVYHT
jgi:hypothetical protein